MTADILKKVEISQYFDKILWYELERNMSQFAPIIARWTILMWGYEKDNIAGCISGKTNLSIR